MDKMELIAKLFEIIIFPLLGALAAFAINFLSAKAKELKQKTSNDTAKKYIDMITQTVKDCVIATNQTYVNALKEKGSFDAEAQKIAFQKTLNAVTSVLSDDAMDYISNITSDATLYLTQLIESTVYTYRA